MHDTTSSAATVDIGADALTATLRTDERAAVGEFRRSLADGSEALHKAFRDNRPIALSASALHSVPLCGSSTSRSMSEPGCSSPRP